MQTLSWYSYRCTRTLPELAAPLLARQRHEQDAPVRRVRDDGDICERVNIERVLQRSRKGQTERQIGIGRSRGRQSHHRADLLAKEIGYCHGMAGGIRADQRARQKIVGNRGRIDTDAEYVLNGIDRVDDKDRIASAGTRDKASGRIGRGAVAVRSAIRRHGIVNHGSRAANAEGLGLAAGAAIGDAHGVTAGVRNGYLMIDIIESHGDGQLSRGNGVRPTSDGIHDRDGVGHAVGDGDLSGILIGGRADRS